MNQCQRLLRLLLARDFAPFFDQDKNVAVNNNNNSDNTTNNLKTTIRVTTKGSVGQVAPVTNINTVLSGSLLMPLNAHLPRNYLPFSKACSAML